VGGQDPAGEVPLAQLPVAGDGGVTADGRDGGPLRLPRGGGVRRGVRGLSPGR